MLRHDETSVGHPQRAEQLILEQVWQWLACGAGEQDAEDRIGELIPPNTPGLFHQRKLSELPDPLVRCVRHRGRQGRSETKAAGCRKFRHRAGVHLEGEPEAELHGQQILDSSLVLSRHRVGNRSVQPSENLLISQLRQPTGDRIGQREDMRPQPADG